MQPRASSSTVFFVECGKAKNDVVVAQINGPTIGFGNGGVDLVVLVAQDADSPLVIDSPVLALDSVTGAELFQHATHLGQG